MRFLAVVVLFVLAVAISGCNERAKEINSKENASSNLPRSDATRRQVEGSPAFDPDDFERTKRWMMSEIAGLKQTRQAGNEIRFDQAAEQFNARVSALNLVGQEVNQSVPVAYVSNTAVALVDRFDRPDPYLYLGADQTNEISLEVGHEISRDQAASLSRGQPLPITAKITMARFDKAGSGIGEPQIELWLGDVRAIQITP